MHGHPVIKPNAIKRSVGERVFEVVNLLVMAFLVVIFIAPFWHTLMYSLSDTVYKPTTGFYFWLRGFDISAYKVLITHPTTLVLSGFRVSTIVTAASVLWGTLLTAMTAYPLTKRYLDGNRLLTFLVFFTMLFSGGMIPSYLLVKNLKLMNTYWALILPVLVSGYNVFLMMNFFRNLPDEVEESAFIDGASHLTVFWRIVLPLSKPVLATIALFTAVGRWNDYFSSVMYIQDSRMWSLGQVLRNMVMSDFFKSATAQVASSYTDIGLTTVKVRYATIIISAVPMLIIYPFAQRYFITGIMIGSVKG